MPSNAHAGAAGKKRDSPLREKGDSPLFSAGRLEAADAAERVKHGRSQQQGDIHPIRHTQGGQQGRRKRRSEIGLVRRIRTE